MGIAIAIGFVFPNFFLRVPVSKGQAELPEKKREKNKANGNDNAHANFDWYFLVLFFKIVQAHLGQAHLAFSNLC